MKKSAFDKYELYNLAVQSPENDVEFLDETYRSLRKKRALSFREDFCGTFALSCAWVQFNKRNTAIGIDLDSEPIRYGRARYLAKLELDESRRINVVQRDVIAARVARVDIIAAMNFSYYLFKTRARLKKYFGKCLIGLKPKGLFFVDCFGGPLCEEANEEKRRVDGFSYFWDQESFNPITNEAQFHIHFQRPGERKRKYQFSYDWRLWDIPELRDLMLEVGFKKAHVYWEGTNRRGEGNGIFRRREKGEECDAWVAYVVGEK